MKGKSKILLASLTTMGLAGATLAGATAALFTSQDEANVAVTSGKVNMTATIDNVKTYSADATLTEGELVPGGDNLGVFSGDYYYREMTGGEFLAGGSAALENGTLTLKDIVPGDMVRATFNLTNTSSVAIQYRLRAVAEQLEGYASNDAFEHLKFKFANVDYSGCFYLATEWTTWAAPQNEEDKKQTHTFEVSLPLDVTNIAQECGANIKLMVEAVQSNVTYSELPEAIQNANAKLAEGVDGLNSLGDVVNALKNADSDLFTPMLAIPNLIFNSESVKFGVLDDAGHYYFGPGAVEVNGASVWQFKDTVDGNEKVGVYLTGSSVIDEIVANGSVAVGENTVKKITYTSASPKIVCFETSIDTDLVIDAPNATIYHFGKAGSVNIISCGDHSYYEYGETSFLRAVKGHIIDGGKISVMHLAMNDANYDVQFDCSEILLPKFERDVDTALVRSADEKVLTYFNGVDTKLSVYLSNQGLFEENFYQNYVKNETTGEKLAVADIFDELKDALASISNAIQSSYTPTQEEIDAGELDISNSIEFAQKIKANGMSEKEVERQQKVQKVYDEYDVYGEPGMEADDSWYDPQEDEFEIAGGSQVAAIEELVAEGETFEDVTITLSEDLYLNPINDGAGEGSDFEAVGTGSGGMCENPFEGTFDGGGKAIKNMTQDCYAGGHDGKPYGMFGYVQDATFKNIVIDGFNIRTEYENAVYANGAGGLVGVASGDCLFENITVRNSSFTGYYTSIAPVIGAVFQGNVTMNNINVEDTVTVGSWYGAYDTQAGGVIGCIDVHTATSTAGFTTSVVHLSNSKIAPQVYPEAGQCRSMGMLLGGCTVNNKYGIDANCSPVSRETLEATLICENVEVIFGEWNTKTSIGVMDVLAGNRLSGGDQGSGCWLTLPGVTKTYLPGAGHYGD